MKNIVVCFDGTWNNADAQFPTNVVKTAKLLLPTDTNGADQVVFYDAGVGSGKGPVAKSLESLLGGAFGVGLMDNIEHAYRFLTFNYVPGDKIFVFGFSRGAFSARSFGGLIRTCGILRKEHVGRVKEAVALYKNRDREAGPDAPPCREFRRDYSFASYRGDFDGGWHVAAGGQAAREYPLTIEYMGIWDTVGALGVPSQFFFSGLFNRKYQFHDLALSRMVRSARHALAIDERRRTFMATPWSNIDELNREAVQSGADPAALPYLQQWFPGDHASVGGGGDVNGLWQAALVWVVEGAEQRGLAVDGAELEQYRKDRDHRASVYCMKKAAFSLAAISTRRWRDGPKHPAEVSEIACQRVREAPANLFERKPYRPKTLKAVIKMLEG
jgi:uncharacterized protein (DUF2235 family)